MASPDKRLPVGRRIAVYGAGGKSTLARAIATRYSLAYIETDSIHHLPAWKPRPFEDTRQIVLDRMAAATDGWVIDGNYAALRPHYIRELDTAIVIQLPFRVLFWRVLKRTVGRSWRREVIHGGNRESWRLSFASRNSILYEVWQKRHRFRSMGETIRAELPDSAKLVILRTTRELDSFYQEHDLVRW